MNNRTIWKPGKVSSISELRSKFRKEFPNDEKPKVISVTTDEYRALCNLLTSFQIRELHNSGKWDGIEIICNEPS